MQWLLYLLALAAGVALPVQSGLNAQVSRVLGQPVFSALWSFGVGAAALMLYSAVRRLPLRDLGQVAQLPAWGWLPGVLGAFYVTATVVLVPRLGAVLTFALIIGGQMLISLLLDHFGLLGLAVKPLSAGRLAGAALLVVGVLLIRRF
ncbi:DMT family transporter [Hymenobacter sp.]|uniref:DMT family transporter n=1 Tax=Hymenobacter sp. TaxID=1898978 RepID=UPI00286AB74E|nr:DMT family transporter [Hymenobacter sp.]